MTEEIKQRIEQIRQGIVPDGYKNGKYSVIPFEWSQEILSNLSDNITKGATPTTYGYTWEDQGILFLRSDCVSENGFVSKAPVFISEEAHKMMNRSVVQAGDILISITGYLGKVGLVPTYIHEANINQHIARVRPYADRCNSTFVYYYLGTAPLKKWFELIQTGQAYPQLSLEQIRQIKIPAPPIQEQQRIAEVLTAQNRTIELKEKLLAEKQRQKKYLMQQLLTGKKRLSGFDGGWMYVRANQIFKNVIDKKHNGTLEVLSATQDRGIIPRSQVDIDIKYAEESLTGYKKVVKGNFVISLRSFQGGIEYSEHTGIVSPAYTVLTSMCPIEDGYYKQFFKSTDYINRLNIAVYGIRDGKQISYDDFGRIMIPYPPLEEQKAIATVLATADKEIEILKQAVEQEKQKKKALMQLLLTGIVRV